MNILECGGALTRQRTPQQRAQLVTNDRSILRGIQEGIQAQSNAGVASNDRRFSRVTAAIGRQGKQDANCANPFLACY
jgi:hypothetical protein